jgi:alkaline phosphatase
LKTILEYAEEHGLSTGIITDDDVSAATPAACYAHANDRKKATDIFQQLLTPRFGDGVDILIGEGKTVMNENPPPAWEKIESGLRDKGYSVVKSLDQFQPAAKRAIVLLGPEDFDMSSAIRRTREVLSRNKKGYFLMVEVDVHTTQLKRGLERVVYLDKLVAEAAQSVGNDTLVIFAADHSFDTRLRGGRIGAQLLPPVTAATQTVSATASTQTASSTASAQTTAGTQTVSGTASTQKTTAPLPPVRIGEGHSGEEVVVAAKGPGAERVRGFFSNTQLFRIMMDAYGWKEK